MCLDVIIGTEAKYTFERFSDPCWIVCCAQTFLLTAHSDLDSKVLSIAETLNTVSLCFWQGIEIA